MPPPPSNPNERDVVIADPDVAVVINYANRVLLASARARDAVIVFDIDSTLLFNRDNMPCRAVLNTQVKRLYDTAIAHDMPVFIVTARAETPSNRAFTLEQLACLGLSTFTTLYMRPAVAGSSVVNIAYYKKECRKHIVRMTNKRIALNVGDQWSDLFVCDAATATVLDNTYGTQALCFVAPPHSFCDWCVKLPDIL